MEGVISDGCRRYFGMAVYDPFVENVLLGRKVRAIINHKMNLPVIFPFKSVSLVPTTKEVVNFKYVSRMGSLRSNDAQEEMKRLKINVPRGLQGVGCSVLDEMIGDFGNLSFSRGDHRMDFACGYASEEVLRELLERQVSDDFERRKGILAAKEKQARKEIKEFFSSR